ncbi:LysE family translocator [Aeromicrobium sp.]|uniref:LysE family translocator n=1 Tax=Aeromicrobium sp. TaxID=1871063 RepID=UPI0030C5FC35
MIPLSTALAIVAVVLIGAMSPGPDFFVLLSRTLSSGRRPGLICAAGMATGISIWVCAVDVGAAALLSVSATAFTLIKLAGAAYLIALGIQAWLSVRGGRADAAPPTTRSSPAATRSFREGLLCNLLNPKVALFYLAFLPQFIPPGRGWMVTVELGVLATTTVLCWYALVVTLTASVRRFIGSRRARRVLDAAMGAVMIGLGVQIAAAQRG